MSEENNLNNKSNKGFERFEEFMDNNSFDIEVEPMDIPTAPQKDNADSSKHTENDAVKTEPEKAPVEEQKKPEKKSKGLTSGMVALIALIVIVGGIVSIAVYVNVSKSVKRIQRMWEHQLEGYAWGADSIVEGLDRSKYKELSQEEQLEVDYKVLLKLAEGRAGEYTGARIYENEDYDKAVKSYLRFSKGGLKPRKNEILEEFSKIKNKEGIYEFDGIDYNIVHEYNEDMAIGFLYTVPISDQSMDSFFIEIADYYYQDEMIDGCARIIADFETGNTEVGHFVNRAKAYLKHTGVTSIPNVVAKAKETMAAEKAAEEAELKRIEDTFAALNDDKSSSSSSSGSSSSSSYGSGSGSGSSGRWNPSGSGGGAARGGLKLNDNSDSSSSSGSSSSSSSKDLNGWADYDEGYDDVMYNDEYDEERYKTDSEYASGVDDARDEYAEVYGEEFD